MRKAKFFPLLLFMLFVSNRITAQMNIGSSSPPDTSAILQLSSTTKGLRLPQVSISSTSSFGLVSPTLSANTPGMMVYNTNVSITGTVAYPAIPGGIGVYYWDGIGWWGVKVLIASKLNISDTVSMLSPYVDVANNGIIKSGKTVLLGGALTQATTITASTTNTLALAGLQSAGANDSIVTIDPTTNVLKRISSSNIKTDTSGLSNRINVKVNISDTAAMLSSYIDAANNGITKSSKTVLLGGALTQATTITASTTNTLALAGLQSAGANDSIVTIDPTTNVLKRISSSNIKTDTSGLSNRINVKVNISDTAAMLSSYIDAANNGITKSSKTVLLGGALTQATTITASATNTLALAGLQSAGANDSIVTIDPTTNVLKRISTINIKTDTSGLSNRINVKVNISDTAAMLSSYIDAANNGITKSGKTVLLGGALTQATTITASATNTLALAGLQSAGANDSILTIDPTTNVITRIARIIPGTISGGYYVQGTSSANVPVGTTIDVPGVSITITVPTGKTMTFLFTMTGYMTQSGSTTGAQGVFILLQNGVKISSAFTSSSSGGTLVNLPSSCSFLKSVVLSAGTYTFKMQYAAWSGSNQVINYVPTTYSGYNGDTESMLTKMQVLVYYN